VAVVLDQGVHPVAIHHAGDVAVLTLEPRIPQQEIAQDFGPVRLGHRRTHDHAIPHPGTGVAARSRLDRLAVAIDQDVARRGAETFDRAVGNRRHLPLDRRENILPQCDGLLLAACHRGGGTFKKRHRNYDFEGTFALRHGP